MKRRSNYLQARGEDWLKARMRALVRDDFTCQAHQLGLPACTENRLRKLVVHHKVMRINGGTHDLDNLLTLCYACHSRVHPHLRFELTHKDRTLELPDREL